VTVTDDTAVVISLAPNPSTTGQITNADGSPAVGFSVCYEPTGLSGSACTQTDSNGQYQLVLAPGPYSLSIFGRAPGIGSIELAESVTIPSAPTLIQLAPTRSVAIKLVNEDGTPLAGAEIFSICTSVPALSGGTERFCADPPASDASGLVTVVAPVGSPLELQIEPAPAVSFRTVSVDAIAASDATELTIAIQSPATP